MTAVDLKLAFNSIILITYKRCEKLINSIGENVHKGIPHITGW